MTHIYIPSQACQRYLNILYLLKSFCDNLKPTQGISAAEIAV